MQGQGTYLENYLESISTAPTELNRSLALIKELDYRSGEVVDKIETLKANLLATTPSGRKAAQELLNEKSSKSLKNDIKMILEYADEKVELSNQSYELIDRYIRKLDTELKKFETEIEEAEDDKKKKKSSITADTPKKGKSSSTLSRKKSQAEIVIPDPKMASSSELDMAIDPNEPTYCICGRVSFGEMIECESSGCKIEWFHFECVGLTQPPKGKWYCPDCTKKRSLK
ncbi:PHD zinc finger-containing protein [Cavenderia fasciculata]|uniref:Inhibitor of growth protein n=1 Tax=Cavenderia fasciculata TaxID=261658 RepID=F4Q9E7_CACFS|nr:PHD zinc finger-containing protein [Cavenderia fasciculata]EGG15316.1 PHD zinc finger-containing protein [Cavenderia fasciculata]|eukprot:XP_004352036.1 PHD zinc finger-containing protein [Cavenderia fasciculata]